MSLLRNASASNNDCQFIPNKQDYFSNLITLNYTSYYTIKHTAHPNLVTSYITVIIITKHTYYNKCGNLFWSRKYPKRGCNVAKQFLTILSSSASSVQLLKIYLLYQKNVWLQPENQEVDLQNKRSSGSNQFMITLL